ncbi:efflux RND transporter periplasmic adaptor subunit [Ferrimonas pelagia]|uniref:Efflux RND transporter periplasmic adaptor subunit n=1 Tax=Ferrimonas pelagia TaxID=1177826 RepID=A0ABP9EZM9_9GAMM
MITGRFFKSLSRGPAGDRLIPKILLAAALCAPALSHAETTQVDVYFPTTDQHQRNLLLTGTVEARQHADLAPLQDGVVAAIFAERGEQVAKGQKLLTLDSRLAELELQRVEAEVRASKVAQAEAVRRYQEVLGLSEQQLVPTTQMEERRSAVSVAEADLNRATALLALQQERLDRHTLYAPFAGVISARSINLGEWITRQSSVFTLVQQQDLRLALQVPQEYYARLVGTPDTLVTLLPETSAQQSSQVRLSQLVEVVSADSRTMTALVDLPRDAGWVPGMSARAQIALPRSELSVSWIPSSAVKAHPDGGASVFAVEQDRAKRYQVEIVERQEGRVAVMGLPADHSIVFSGIELLNDGDPVQIQHISGRTL